MKITDFLHALYGMFAPVTLMSFVLISAILGIMFLSKYKFQLGQVSFLVAFSLLGSVAGLITGVSQESIVGALLTGLLGLMTTLLTYMLGKESLIEWRTVIPMALILLMLSALGGLSIGAAYKKERSSYERKYSQWLLRYENVDLELCKAERLSVMNGGQLPIGYVPTIRH
ncbi:hypothetical protein [Pseudomonas sp. F01002]|uniref:hypothetical protein n=1 Tax=Pseudomonas sp. F01002 TaxID=2555724 RepID=UPI001068FAAE|nr:hypothetical protein [Pseudomonas sp. F01002]TFB39018.1 hypothetical protein E3W21_17705 [Pseudomonas sp. F01002]